MELAIDTKAITKKADSKKNQVNLLKLDIF
jgi:hypothetical protein